MSDTIIIDTGSGLSREETIKPLPLYDEHHPMLKAVMPEHDINMLPNPVISKFARRLLATMHMYQGIGLSANQCGIQERMFVIGDFVCINPKIVNHSANIIKMKEGCLSYPGLYVTIDRYYEIDVEYYDVEGQLQQRHFEGVTAQAFQHELDHMNGITFTSYVKPVALQLARQKQQKIVKKVKRQTNGQHI
jgi:peptide deformylase